ncbi:hypothetical protein [Pseudomonas synxantha]|uniref:Uncharacterized protein n=1 Tax=Pseudomonas synxantha TaxID=47883 RepID=A0A5D3GDS2_9PSED|nr:hypothetical protein [Pseudomonas synxantha]TYK57898.1 hypothetical protein FXO26_11615 [Pseudomonas synxantha]
MSGPKVVRIVTREEIIAICEGHLQRLELVLARWQAQASKVGELNEQERVATFARRDRLRALLAQERFAELQKAVPAEIEHLRRDQGDREERAIIRAAQRRQRERRLKENAATLLEALQARSEGADQDLLRSLTQLANGIIKEDGERLLAAGFVQLAKADQKETLSEAQRALAQLLKVDDTPNSLSEWMAARHPDTLPDIRLQRINRHIAELQLLQGTDSAASFLQAQERAEAEPESQRRNLLLDSLVLDLASSTRTFKNKRESLERLQDLASEMETQARTDYTALFSQISTCTTVTNLETITGLTEQCEAFIATHLQAEAALARREAVLSGLASLGYEVREGMATAWAETGKVVLRKVATPGYGVEVGGKADNGRLQVRAVALSGDRDKTRDRDIETIWCSEFQRLQARLKDRGSELLIERSLSVGEVPLKEASASIQVAEAVIAQQKTV